MRVVRSASQRTAKTLLLSALRAPFRVATYSTKERPVTTEAPNTVHGRLLEAMHVSGYTFERACGELEWLLDEDRWQRVGDGFTDINKFLATIDFSDFRVALDQRKKLAKRLQAIEASQRATARLLGVGETTIRRDLDTRAPLGAQGPVEATEAEENQPSTEVTALVGAPPAWFQVDADPSSDGKRLARNAARVDEREHIRDRSNAPALTGCYRLIYADPPWRYEHVVTESRAIENQYPTMSLDDICALRVPAADDAVLFLWATSPKLAEAMRVIDAWGFSYRTCAVWDKDALGMGYYFRQQHELLLVAARGASVVPAASARPSSVLRARRGRHSEKPAFVYDLLELMYPEFSEADRIELFQREPRAGWSAWGNEATT